MRGLAHEVKHACRALAAKPLFATLAASTLALGIGASTAAFTVLDAIVFRPLRVPEPQRLVQLATLDQQGRTGYISLAALNVIDREQILENSCAFLTPQATIEVNGRVGPAAALALSKDCFAMLGVTAAAGRLIAPADSTPGAANVAVLSYDLWQSEFDGRPDAIGRVVKVEGEAFTIIGATPRHFTGLQVGFPPRLMVPLEPKSFLPAPLRPSLAAANVFARLPRGTSRQQLAERLQTLWPGVLRDSVPPALDDRARQAWLASRLSVSTAQTGLDSTVRSRFAYPLTALLGIALLVLIVSCVNLANLLLARAVLQRREHAIRAALGASRGQLVLEAAMESALLLIPAVIGGVWLSYLAATALVSIYRLTSANFSIDVAPEARTLVFVGGTACVAWICFALGPVVRRSRVDPAATLTASSSRHTTGDARPRRLLLIAQIAMTAVLVASAAWFADALRQLRNTPLGFTTDAVISARLAPMPAGYNPPFNAFEYYRRLVESVEALPGVGSVAVTSAQPLSAFSLRTAIATSDRPESEIDVQVLRVSHAFFRTLSLPMIAGQDFSRSDRPGGVRTAIVSESLARRLFDRRDAVGEYIRVGTQPADQRIRVVGIAADARLNDPRSSDMFQLYVNYWQQEPPYQQFPALLVKSEANPAAFDPAFRALLAREGREYALSIRGLSDNLEATLIQERLLAIASSFFGAIGLLLAGSGLFALLSVIVASRTREFGIRMAVGATRRQVVSLVLGETLVSLASGLGAGVPLVWFAGRFASSLLHGVNPVGLSAAGITVAAIAAIGLLATWLPARRATRINPLDALRSE